MIIIYDNRTEKTSGNELQKRNTAQPEGMNDDDYTCAAGLRMIGSSLSDFPAIHKIFNIKQKALAAISVTIT